MSDAYFNQNDLVSDETEDSSDTEMESDAGTVESMTSITTLYSFEEIISGDETYTTDDEEQLNPHAVDDSHNDKFKCPVCLTSFEKLITMAIRCVHVLCKDCIDALATRGIHNCPVCTRRYARSSVKRIFL